MKILNLLIAASLFPIAAISQELRGISLPYSTTSFFTVGSGIDVDLINQARGTCLSFQESEIVWLDGGGAISTEATVELISDYTSLAKTLNLEVDYKSKADVSINALKAGGAVDFNLKYDTFARDETRSLALVVKAASDYGRRGLRDYKLKQSAASSTGGALFRQMCGTHTIVAQRNVASLAVVILLSDLSSTSKQSIEGLYKSSFNASGKINVATLSAQSESTSKWKNLVEAASKMGKMSVRFEAKGGAGVPDATKLLVTSDPGKIDEMLKAVAAAGASFTKDNSVPVGYFLVPNSALGGPLLPGGSAEKLEALNNLFLTLARVDYGLSRISGYEQSFPALYGAVYSKEVGRLKIFRGNVVSAIERCVLEDKCEFAAPKDLALLYMEDVIQPEEVWLDCSYSRITGKDASGAAIHRDVLNFIAVKMRGKIRLADYVEVKTAVLTRFSPDSQGKIQIIPTFPSVEVSAPREGQARIIAMLDYAEVKPSHTVTAGSIHIQNLDELVARRDYYQSSIYAIGVQAKNGLPLRNSVGPAFGGNCPVVK